MIRQLNDEEQQPIIDGSRQDKSEDDYKEILEIYKNGLDDLVSMNSVLAFAIFVGLSFSTPGHSLVNRKDCNSEISQAKRLVVMEVISFSFFLLSTLAAKALKVNLQVNYRHNFKKDCRLNCLKWLTLLLSVTTSFLGSVFLIISIFYVIEIRLGMLYCKNPYMVIATVSMFVVFLVITAVYVWLVWFIVCKARKHDVVQQPAAVRGDHGEEINTTHENGTNGLAQPAVGESQITSTAVVINSEISAQTAVGESEIGLA